LTYLADGYLRSEELVLGTGVKEEIAHEDFEGTSAWQHQAAESTASSGDWIVSVPYATGYQPGHDVTADPGSYCLFTGLNISDPDTFDVDGGVVVARSGAYDLSGHPEVRLSLWRWFGNRDLGEDSGDFFRLEIREDSSAPDQLLEQLGHLESATAWTEVSFRVADYVTPGPQVELKVSASDASPVPNIIEAAIDEILFWEPHCEVYNPLPNPVTGLRLSVAGSDVELDWSPPNPDPAHGEADRYRIYRSDTPDGGWALLDELATTADPVQYADGGGIGGADLRFYQVVAANDAGDSEVLP
jgi:hypothetical protein